MKNLPAFLNTPAGMVSTVGLLIIVVEFLIMLSESFLSHILEVKHQLLDIIDPILLVLIISPALYILIFRPVRDRQAELERQLDELRRFQKVTVGRELRMKELVEENTALRNQLASAKPDSTRP